MDPEMDGLIFHPSFGLFDGPVWMIPSFGLGLFSQTQMETALAQIQKIHKSQVLFANGFLIGGFKQYVSICFPIFRDGWLVDQYFPEGTPTSFPLFIHPYRHANTVQLFLCVANSLLSLSLLSLWKTTRKSWGQRNSGHSGTLLIAARCRDTFDGSCFAAHALQLAFDLASLEQYPTVPSYCSCKSDSSQSNDWMLEKAANNGTPASHSKVRARMATSHST